MIRTQRRFRQYPQLVISLIDKSVDRQVSEVTVTIKVDGIRVEIQECSTDGFGRPAVHEGSNAMRQDLIEKAVRASKASSLGVKALLEAEIETFLNEHIGAAREQQSATA